MLPPAIVSAKRWTLITLYGTAISVAALILLPARDMLPRHTTLAFSFVIVGMVIALGAQWRLSSAIKHDLCSSDEVETLRRNTRSMAWKTLHTCVAIIALMLMILSTLTDSLHSWNPVAYAAFILSNTMALINSAVRERTPKSRPAPSIVPIT